MDRAESRLGSSSSLIAEIRDVLDAEKSIYSDDLGYLSLSGSFSPEVYLQSNASDSVSVHDPDEDWWIKDHMERKPYLSLTLENGLYDSVYGKFVMEAKQKKYVSGYWNQTVSSNFRGAALSQNFPFEAGISVGTKGMNLIIARDHVSLGEGKTGNTAVGDVFDFQEFLKASFFTRNTGVHLNITSFDSSHDVAIADPFRVNNTSFSGWRQIRHTVDYEFILMNKLRFSLGFVGLWDTDNAFDLRMFNPFMVFHNMYNFHETTALEANNIITLDVSFAFAPKWNLYVQATMDQFQISGEADGYVEEFGYTDPNALGGLLNVSYTEAVDKGILRTYGELVVNGPALYLNEKYYDANGKVTQHRYADAEQTILNRRCWSQDYLVGYTRTDENAHEMEFAGYTYGPDCIVVAIGADYVVLNKYSVSTQLFYMA
ncbi:MAG: hypothetical protein KBS81_01715, partial [Spirochaetales bacterium]|nr:hypothetical protein [Candidatus Physcosoma equi]